MTWIIVGACVAFAVGIFLCIASFRAYVNSMVDSAVRAIRKFGKK